MITAILKIAGATINRAAARVTLQRVSFGIQGEEMLAFTQEVVGSLQGSYTEGQSVTLAFTDGTTTTTVFRGVIVSHTTPGIGMGVIDCGYLCRGMRFLAQKTFSTTGADGTGTIQYNLPRTDPSWALNLSALPVGTILADYFSQHSSQLAALGISQPPAGDLTPLTVVPNSSVVLNGPIFDMVDNLLRTWGYSNLQCYIDPDTLQVRVVDTTALPAATLTMGVDPIQVQDLTTDISNCFTRVVARGGEETLAAILELQAGTLAQGWTSGQQSSWTILAYNSPSNQVAGSITSMTTTSVTADAFVGLVTTWAVNYWSEAQIWVQQAGGTGGAGINFSESAEVLSCTAASGGSATFTLDIPVTNTNYTKVEVRGAPTGESLVWRKYTIPDSVTRNDGSPINLHLVQYLNGSVPFNTTSGVVIETSGPSAEVYYSKGCTGSQASWFATFNVYPSPDGVAPGYIVFTEPTVMAFSSPSSLAAGTPDGVPCNIKVLVPYSNGALAAASPSSGYSGTAYSTYGVQWTLYRDYPNWLSNFQNSPANMQLLTSNVLASTRNAVISGTCIYHGVPLSLMTLGQSLNLRGQLFGTLLAPTAFTSMACAIRNITVEWPDYGGAYQVTQLRFTNQRMAYTGDSLFLHPLATRPQAEGFAVGGGVSYDRPGTGGGREASPGLDGSDGDAEPARRYRKPSERRADRGRSSLATQAAEGKLAERKRREALRARNAKRRRPDEDRRSDEMMAAYEPPTGGAEAYQADQQRAADEADQREGDRRVQAGRDKRRSGRTAEAMRPSDNAIVRAHERAYGGHDPEQAIVDAHRRSVAGDGDTGELASND